MAVCRRGRAPWCEVRRASGGGGARVPQGAGTGEFRRGEGHGGALEGEYPAGAGSPSRIVVLCIWSPWSLPSRSCRETVDAPSNARSAAASCIRVPVTCAASRIVRAGVEEIQGARTLGQARWCRTSQ
jgi:hypothetical protein